MVALQAFQAAAKPTTGLQRSRVHPPATTGQFKAAQHQIVAVGNTVHWSTKWKTFLDFLMDYMKGKLGSNIH